MGGETRRQAVHWTQESEKAAGYWQLKFLLFLFRIFPVIVLRIIAFPVGFFYFVFSKSARTESYRFFQRIAGFIEDPSLAKRCRSAFAPLRHIISFSLTMIEKIQAWDGRFSLKNIEFHDDDIAQLKSSLEQGKGAFLVFSHLGNSELLRGLLNFNRTGVSRNIPVTAIMDMKVTSHFRRMLKELNPRSSVDIIGSDEIGPQTADILESRLAEGGLVLVSGDRTPAAGDKNLMIPFFGKPAPFPFGIFYLFSLLEYPVYFVFGVNKGNLSLIPRYNMYVHKYSISFDCPRKEKIQRTSLLAQSFADYLESYCKKYPFQWYNFFDFWQEGEV